jgi:hypothetical protein
MEERSQIGRLAANVLNKQTRTTDKGFYSNLGVGRGAKNSLSQKMALLRNGCMCLGPGLIVWYVLSNGKGT